MKPRKAIVTLCVGQRYQQRWNTLCARNWQQYADRHGYDVICIDAPLDHSPRARSRSPAWQKCLILGDERVRRYPQVVWMDSDILINPKAPCIVSQVPEDNVGAVNSFHPRDDETGMDRAVEYMGWPFRSAAEYYAAAALPECYDQVVQTGVMVLSPTRHHSLLEFVYQNYNGTPVGDHEMESLSFELIKNTDVHWLGDRFNRLWILCMFRDYPFLLPPRKAEIAPVRVWKRLTRGQDQLPPKGITAAALTTAFLNNYFLHFAAVAHYMPWVDTNIHSWNDISLHR
jgi:hypothetical protein